TSTRATARTAPLRVAARRGTGLCRSGAVILTRLRWRLHQRGLYCSVCTLRPPPATVQRPDRESGVDSRGRGGLLPAGRTLRAACRTTRVRAMAAFRIAVIGGDGIGPEVIDQAIRAAEAAAKKHDRAEFRWNKLPWSSSYYKQQGRMMPDDGWDTLKQHD